MKSFPLPYLVDNGTLSDWETAVVSDCRMFRWTESDGTVSYTVRDSSGNNLGWGETKEEAFFDARCYLTERRRKLDGITPAKIC